MDDIIGDWPVEMTSRRSAISLAAGPCFLLLLLLLVGDRAGATEPSIDFIIRIKNDSKQVVEICNSSGGSCQVVQPSAEFVDSQATDNDARGYAEFWLSKNVGRACGRAAPLSTLVADRRDARGWWGKLLVTGHLTDQSLTMLCGEQLRERQVP